MPALMWGDIRLVAIDDSVFAFERSYGDEKILAAFNLSADAVDASTTEFSAWRQIGSTGLPEGELVRGRLRLPAHGAVFAIPLTEAG
jgi:alpha-glucosidase